MIKNTVQKKFDNIDLDHAIAEISKEEKLARISLYRVKNIGPYTYRKILKIYKTGLKALQAWPKIAERSGLKGPLGNIDLQKAEKELKAHENIGANIFVDGECGFPITLQGQEDTPPVLSIKGNVNIFTKPLISVVGARNCSLAGKKLAHSVANDLGQEGYVIVSGLARGIDTQAHLGSINTGTIGVIAGGIDQIYPPENEYLYDKITGIGAIVSESPFGTEPIGNLFPRRNYLIASLSQCVVVIEAALKSGSCITARYAFEQGKDICVFPGHVLDPRYVGSHNLIRNNYAAFVTCIQDIINVINGPCQKTLQESNNDNWKYDSTIEDINLDKEPIDSIKEKILNLLSKTPVATDEIIREFNDPTAVILSALLELELGKKIVRHTGNMISL